MQRLFVFLLSSVLLVLPVSASAHTMREQAARTAARVWLGTGTVTWCGPQSAHEFRCYANTEPVERLMRPGERAEYYELRIRYVSPHTQRKIVSPLWHLSTPRRAAVPPVKPPPTALPPLTKAQAIATATAWASRYLKRAIATDSWTERYWEPDGTVCERRTTHRFTCTVQKDWGNSFSYYTDLYLRVSLVAPSPAPLQVVLTRNRTSCGDCTP